MSEARSEAQSDPQRPATCRHPFQRQTLADHVLELQAEIARLREDNLQLRAALSIYSELARQSLPPAQRPQ